jgi:hypothetical protein
LASRDRVGATSVAVLLAHPEDTPPAVRALVADPMPYIEALRALDGCSVNDQGP